MTPYEKLESCYRSIRDKLPFIPRVGLVLGSGLGGFADGLQIEASIDYREIAGFPVSTVEGHRGRFVFAHIGDVPTMIMQGRVHYYEGYPMSDVVLPIRLMGLTGARNLFLTNAAGGLNPAFSPGDFMLLTDQIATFVPSPLIGANMDTLGTRFPDMSRIYDQKLQTLVRQTAEKLDIPLQEGVYVQLTGPNYETPHEVALCRLAGGDAVGMSTACEAIAAHHMGMRVCGISCISNMGCGMTEQPLSHEEVKATGDKAAPLLTKLLTAAISALADPEKRHSAEQ